MFLADVDVLIPTSPAEAAQAFGDGKGVAVIGGGTIAMPELTAGRLRPAKVLLLARAGLDRITRAGGVVTIGAAVPISGLEGGDEPLAAAAAHVGDPEIRAQATVGGNLCAGPGAETPRGDLQAPLIVLDARVRSAGKGGERVEPIEEFLEHAEGRLVLDVSYDDVARRTGYAAAWRPHAHHYTILAVAAAKTDGELRVAVTGAGPHALRLPSVEAGGEPADALKDVAPPDDALASAWYRKTLLPRLVERAISDLAVFGRAGDR